MWALPGDVGNANLNTVTFDGDGIVWFTGQSGIYGRLDPATGDMKIFHAPEGRGPYGTTATPDGDVYFVSLAGSYLASIDRKSGEARLSKRSPRPADRLARMTRFWLGDRLAS